MCLSEFNVSIKAHNSSDCLESITANVFHTLAAHPFAKRTFLLGVQFFQVVFDSESRFDGCRHLVYNDSGGNATGEFAAM